MLSRKVLKKALNSINLVLSRYLNITIIPTPKPVINVFKKKYKKKVLISYISKPFKYKVFPKSHTNFLECFTAAEIFDSLKFQVDVVDYYSEYSIDYSGYEVIYGFGAPYNNSFSQNSKLKRLYYGTGCNPHYSDSASGIKVRDFYLKTGKISATSARIVPFTWKLSTLLSDAYIILGNDFVKNTYLAENNKAKIYQVKIFYYDVVKGIYPNKNENSKNNFLWFGSKGLLHKGLDILLDIFEERKNITLHICGADSNELEFWDYYRLKISQCKNIIDHGYIDIQSDKFINILKSCSFSLFPSVSEGGNPSSVMVAANGGIIPIISESSGLNIENLGYIVKDNSKKGFENAIEKVLEMTEREVNKLSEEVFTHFRQNYTYSIYRSSFEKIINDFIKKDEITTL